MGNNRQTIAQPLFRLATQFDHFVICEFGQDRIAAIGHKRTALGDFNRTFNGFGQIRKQRDHFLRAFEVMLIGQPATRILLIDIGPLGDTDQRVMGLIHV